MAKKSRGNRATDEAQVNDDVTAEKSEQVDAEFDTKDEHSGLVAKDYEAGELSEGQLDAARLYLGEVGYSPLLSAEE